MKKDSTALYILRLAVTLLLITGIMAALLALVNSITAPIIAQRNEEKTQNAISLVLGCGGEKTVFTDETGMVTAVYEGQTGYAVQVETAGFGGTITMMVGVSHEGEVLGISIISHAETAGLGAIAGADTSAGQAFRDQFIGGTGTLAVDKDGGQIDSIASATITSRAITNGVNAAIRCAENMG